MQENKNLSVKHYIYGVIYFYRKRKKKGKKKKESFCIKQLDT